MTHQKNGFKIVLNDNEELQSLTGNGSTFLNSTRNFVADRIGKKKCLFLLAAVCVLTMLTFGTVFILQTAAEVRLSSHEARPTKISDSFEARIAQLENELREIKQLLNDRPVNRALMPSFEASGDETSQLTDDENLLSGAPDGFTKSIVGKWKQVRLENMEEYLKAEGASWLFRKLALGVPPELEIADRGGLRYEQVFTAPMYTGKFPIYLNGEVAEYEDGDGTKVAGSSVDNGQSVVITADGGKNGRVVTTLYMKGDEMYLTTVLTDKGSVTASRVFVRNG